MFTDATLDRRIVALPRSAFDQAACLSLRPALGMGRAEDCSFLSSLFHSGRTFDGLQLHEHRSGNVGIFNPGGALAHLSPPAKMPTVFCALFIDKCKSNSSPTFSPLTTCDCTFLSHCRSSPPQLTMSNNQNYGATAGAGAGPATVWYYGVNGWYQVVAGCSNGQASTTHASQGYIRTQGAPPLSACMTDFNLSGTSSAL
jgi:hypothetical protein